MRPADCTVKVVETPPSVTELTLVKPEPVIRMLAPVAPKPGEKPVIFGAPPDVVTVKLAELVPVPFGVVTLIGPLVAPLGTVALTLVSELNVNDADVPLNFTTVAPVKCDPVIETFVPTGPVVGLKDETVGAGGGPPPPYRSRHVEPSFDHSCCR
jgi:hypothetical protein